MACWQHFGTSWPIWGPPDSGFGSGYRWDLLQVTTYVFFRSPNVGGGEGEGRQLGLGEEGPTVCHLSRRFSSLPTPHIHPHPGIRILQAWALPLSPAQLQPTGPYTWPWVESRASRQSRDSTAWRPHHQNPHAHPFLPPPPPLPAHHSKPRPRLIPHAAHPVPGCNLHPCPAP